MKTINKKNHGVAAMEFALVFPILFLMLYGLLTYSLIFVAQHSLNLAVAEGARASIRFQSGSDSLQAREAAACAAIQDNVWWIQSLGVPFSCPSSSGSGLTSKLEAAASDCASQCSLKISLKFDYKAYPILPILLPVPDDLTAQAVSQFSLRF